MNRMLLLSLAGAVIGGALGLVIAVADDGEGQVFIASDQPLTDVQIREKLQSEGWMNIRIVQQGRYFEAAGSKDGDTRKILVDSLSGRLIEDADDD